MSELFYVSIILSGLIFLDIFIILEIYLNKWEDNEKYIYKLFEFIIIMHIILSMLGIDISYRDAWFINITLFASLLSFLVDYYEVIYFIPTSILLFYLNYIDVVNKANWYYCMIFIMLINIFLRMMTNEISNADNN